MDFGIVRKFVLCTEYIKKMPRIPGGLPGDVWEILKLSYLSNKPGKTSLTYADVSSLLTEALSPAAFFDTRPFLRVNLDKKTTHLWMVQAKL